jgi:hypothetical protein
MASLLNLQQAFHHDEFPAYLLSIKRILGREIGLISLAIEGEDYSQANRGTFKNSANFFKILVYNKTI